MNRLLTIIFALLSLQMIAPAHAGETQVPKVLHSMSTPCPTDDAVNCYWDAHKQGNGQGHSFYAIPVGKKICIKYWDAAYDRSHGHCFLP